jgi:hypothetical protein
VTAAQGFFQSFSAVFGPGCFISVEDQNIEQTVKNGRIVFDNQDVRFVFFRHARPTFQFVSAWRIDDQSQVHGRVNTLKSRGTV